MVLCIIILCLSFGCSKDESGYIHCWRFKSQAMFVRKFEFSAIERRCQFYYLNNKLGQSIYLPISNCSNPTYEK
jgi:hypothetical protein